MKPSVALMQSHLEILVCIYGTRRIRNRSPSLNLGDCGFYLEDAVQGLADSQSLDRSRSNETGRHELMILGAVQWPLG